MIKNNKVIKCCPFCGKDGKAILDDRDSPYGYQIGCEDHALDWWFDKEEDAITEWNKRITN